MSESEFADTENENLSARAELDRLLTIAAEALLADYTHDQELTAFTVLDADDYYIAGSVA